MPDKTFIANLKPDQAVTEVFWVRSKEVRTNKNGKQYLSLQLADRTGQLPAFMWNNFTEALNLFEPDDFVEIKGVTQQFNNHLQLNVHKLRKTDRAAVEMSDYIAAAAADPEETFAALCAQVEKIEDVFLKILLKSIFLDEEIAWRFKRAPAAKSLHHAYLGGLMEHTLSLVEMCRMAAERYGRLNGDLLVAGALLHDLGKIYELDYQGPFCYTNEGKLLGHIAIGLDVVSRKVRAVPNFPDETRLQLLHLLVSHHGQLEYGSPKEPYTLEAVVLNYLDTLDSRVGAFEQAASNCSADWTATSALFDRPLYVKKID